MYVFIDIIVKMASYSEEIIIVESNNRSFATNTLSKFKSRLQREVFLQGEHEIALVDITLPYTIYNIKEGDYFTIARFAQKNTVGNKKRYTNII